MQYIGNHVRARYVEHFLPNGKGILLDCGAGAGIYKPLVLSKGYEYIGIDIKPRSPDVVYGDVTNIPFSDNYFDVAICVDVLEHIEKDYAAIKEMFRVLKLKGILVSHVPNANQTHILAEFPEQSDHVRKGYTEEKLDELLSKAGFREIEVHATFNPLECIAWELCNLSRTDETMIQRLIDFDLDKFKNLGWISIAWKG